MTITPDQMTAIIADSVASDEVVLRLKEERDAAVSRAEKAEEAFKALIAQINEDDKRARDAALTPSEADFVASLNIAEDYARACKQRDEARAAREKAELERDAVRDTARLVGEAMGWQPNGGGPVALIHWMRDLCSMLKGHAEHSRREQEKAEVALTDSLFKSVAPEDVANLPRLSEEDIQAAIQRGREDRERVQSAWRGKVKRSAP